MAAVDTSAGRPSGSASDAKGDDALLSDLSSLSDPDSSSDSDSEDSSKGPSTVKKSKTASKDKQPKIEWLATGRAKRATAGNRMKSLLASIGASEGGGGGGDDEDDELELLFAEDEADAGWSLEENGGRGNGGDGDDGDDDGDDDDDGSQAEGAGDDNASDMHMDSSDDEDDDGDDDDGEAGERELQQREREKKMTARKRKAQAAIPARFRKKVRIAETDEADSAAPTSAASTPTTTPLPVPPASASHQPMRKKKKSERTSWLPTLADAPTRASSRATTRSSKEQLYQQMAERERRRQRQLAIMAKKQQRALANKKQPLTQAQRLAEAALVEEANTRSLNTWEEAEKQREDERAAKLAAMYNRTLDGPVVTFWSGIVELSGEGLKHVGRMVSIEEKAPRKKRQTAAAKAAAAAAAAEAGADAAAEATKQSECEVKESKTEDGQECSKKNESAETAEPGDKTVSSNEKGGQDSRDAPQKPAGAPPVKTSLESSSTDQIQNSYNESVFMPLDEPPPAKAESVEPRGLQTEELDESRESKESKESTVDSVDIVMTDAPSAPLEISTLPSNSSTLQPSLAPLSAPSPTVAAETNQPQSETKPPSPENGMDEKEANPEVKIASPTALHPLRSVATPSKDVHASSQSSSETPQADPALSTAAPPNTPPPSSIPPPPTSLLPPQPAKNTNPTPELASVQVPPNNDALTPAQTLPATTPMEAVTASAAEEPSQPGAASAGDDINSRITRTCIVLQNFDEDALKDKQVQMQVLFGRRMAKIAKPVHTPLCSITGHPARYRDVQTGLPFYNSYAYKEIRKLVRGDYRWSSLVGAWAGPAALSQAAAGVPEGFLDPSKVKKKTAQDKESKDKESKDKESKDKERKDKESKDKEGPGSPEATDKDKGEPGGKVAVQNMADKDQVAGVTEKPQPEKTAENTAEEASKSDKPSLDLPAPAPAPPAGNEKGEQPASQQQQEGQRPGELQAKGLTANSSTS